MADFVETLSNPYALTALIVLSILSSAWLWTGLRHGDMPKLCLGIGTLIPTFDILNWKAWAFGAAFCVAGLWVQSKLEGI